MYQNLYEIRIRDDLNYVNKDIHDSLKLLVVNQKLTEFYLGFFGILITSDDGLNLIKQYNQIIKDNNQLECLKYHHSRISREVKYE